MEILPNGKLSKLGHLYILVNKAIKIMIFNIDLLLGYILLQTH